MCPCFVAELEDLPEGHEEGQGGIDGEWRIQEDHIGCIARRIISKSMIDKEQSGHLP